MGKKRHKQSFSPLQINQIPPTDGGPVIKPAANVTGILDMGAGSTNTYAALTGSSSDDIFDEDANSNISRTLGEVDSETDDIKGVAQINGDGSKNGLEEGENTNSTPWRNLFKDNRAQGKGMALHKVNYETTDLCIKEEDVDKLDDWGFCLIVYFAAKFPGKYALTRICKSWGVNYELTLHNSGWLVFKFDTWADREKVLMEGPYYVFGRQLMLKNMPPLFRFDNYEFTVLPIWIKLHGLPIECWTPKVLGKLVSRVGKPICTDKFTLTKERITYARVLVEVDVSIELVKKINITLPNGNCYVQDICYEYEPKFCPGCQAFGHTSQSCRFKEPQPGNNKNKRNEKEAGQNTTRQNAAKGQNVAAKHNAARGLNADAEQNANADGQNAADEGQNAVVDGQFAAAGLEKGKQGEVDINTIDVEPFAGPLNPTRITPTECNQVRRLTLVEETATQARTKTVDETGEQPFTEVKRWGKDKTPQNDSGKNSTTTSRTVKARKPRVPVATKRKGQATLRKVSP